MEEKTFKMATDKTAGPQNQASLNLFFLLLLLFS
jgi:hypothetical protein